MLDSLLTRKAEIVVKNKQDRTQEYTVRVSGAAKKGGNAGNVGLSSSGGETVIQGEVGAGNQDNFIVQGEVTSVEGAVSVSTREVMSASYAGVIYGGLALVLLGILSNFYSS